MQSGDLVRFLLGLPVFQSEWVLWLLLILSLASVGVIVERLYFYFHRRVPIDTIRSEMSRLLGIGDFAAVDALLSGYDSLETNVVLLGVRAAEKGPESVEEVLSGSLGKERSRYEKRLNFLATLASNAPYIGLFGTVLGIIRSFRDLSANMAEASSSVMAGIAEALIATAVGLLVAIPAVMAFNFFKAKVKDAVVDCQMLAKILLAELKDGRTEHLNAGQ